MPARSLVGKRVRRLLVFVHVVVSTGWMGAGAANVVLTTTAAVTATPRCGGSATSSCRPWTPGW